MLICSKTAVFAVKNEGTNFLVAVYGAFCLFTSYSEDIVRKIT